MSAPNAHHPTSPQVKPPRLDERTAAECRALLDFMWCLPLPTFTADSESGRRLQRLVDAGLVRVDRETVDGVALLVVAEVLR